MKLISDNGPCFVFDIFKDLCVKLEIFQFFTVSYRPQCNMVERVKRKLIQMISSYIDIHHFNLDKYLQHFAKALRTAVHESTGTSPTAFF